MGIISTAASYLRLSFSLCVWQHWRVRAGRKTCVPVKNIVLFFLVVARDPHTLHPPQVHIFFIAGSQLFSQRGRFARTIRWAEEIFCTLFFFANPSLTPTTNPPQSLSCICNVQIRAEREGEEEEEGGGFFTLWQHWDFLQHFFTPPTRQTVQCASVCVGSLWNLKPS